MTEKSLGQISPLLQRLRNADQRGDKDADEATNEIERLNGQRRLLQSENEQLKASLAHSGVELQRAVFAERKRCAEWVKNNYQEHASIAMLCDAMRLRSDPKES